MGLQQVQPLHDRLHRSHPAARALTSHPCPLRVPASVNPFRAPITPAPHVSQQDPTEHPDGTLPPNSAYVPDRTGTLMATPAVRAIAAALGHRTRDKRDLRYGPQQPPSPGAISCTVKTY